MNWFFQKEAPTPPPLPVYKRQPIASLAVVLTLIGMFVLGPVGVLWNGMAEELDKKADNETVIMLMQQMKEINDRQWEEIKNNRSQPKAMINNQVQTQKVEITQEIWDYYMTLSPVDKAKFRRLNPAFQALPK